MKRGMVLLSGGLDSVAALHWTIQRCKLSNVAAVGFRYGQLHADAELDAASRIANRQKVPFEIVDLTNAFFGFLPEPVPGLNLTAKEGAGRLVSKANIPARNAVLLSCATSRAAAMWPGDEIDLVGGWNFDDKMGFPDCRPDFIDAMTVALSLSVSGIAKVSVVAPWQRWPKFQIVDWCKKINGASDDIKESVSCYYGTNCKTCDACKFRINAFRLADELRKPLKL